MKKSHRPNGNETYGPMYQYGMWAVGGGGGVNKWAPNERLEVSNSWF